VSTRAVLHPLALLALALLIANDHVFKAAVPGWWTGKLSDVAGLAVFPLLVAAGGELAGLWRGDRRTVVVLAVITGVVFAAIKLSPLAGDGYRVAQAALQWPFRALAALAHGRGAPGLGRAHLTPDVTDLLALPALLVSPALLAATVRAAVSSPRASARPPAPAAAPGR